MLKHKLFAAVLAAASFSAYSADYYVVVPVNRTAAPAAAVSPIALTLASYNLPEGTVGTPYTSFDFKSLLQVTGDPAYTGSNVSFSSTGAVPPGLTLSAAGVLSGTPSVKNTTGGSFQVTASYKTKTGQQAYTLVVNGVTLDVTQISAGGTHTCAVTTSGGAVCWGFNSSGQLGDGTTTNSLTPVAVSGLTSGVSSIQAGTYYATNNAHSCAITTTGSLKCWGKNTYGQLGTGDTTNYTVPTQVVGLTSGVSSVEMGQFHSCALVAGVVKCWGSNGGGQLGLGSSNPSTSTVPVEPINLGTGVKAVATGVMHNCAITASSAVKCWGENTNGQVGRGALGGTYYMAPTADPITTGMTNVSSIGLGHYHSCAVSNGSAYCWGSNAYNQLGFYTDATNVVLQPDTSLAGLVQQVSGVTRVVGGVNHSCALTTAGTVKCWGLNGNGQVGDGTTATRRTAVDVPGLTGVLDLSAGRNHTCVKVSSGIKCWGFNASGQLGNASTTDSLSPVDVAVP